MYFTDETSLPVKVKNQPDFKTIAYENTKKIN